MNTATKDETYNGWTNHATWCCKLWMDNDEGIYHYFREIVEHCPDNVRDTADAIETAWEEFLDDLKASPKRNDTQEALLNDVLSFGLSNVNWEEIASAMIEDAAE